MNPSNLKIDEEELDIELLRTEVACNPSYRNIFSRLWMLIEEIGPNKSLQDTVDFFRGFQQKQTSAMRTEWQRASGKPMTLEQEKLVFGSKRSKVNTALIEKMQDFIEHMHKANEIAKLFGLDEIAPIIVSKKASGWRKGGEAKAMESKITTEYLGNELRKLHEEMKKRSPKLSDHAIDTRIADQRGISANYVYKLRKRKQK